MNQLSCLYRSRAIILNKSFLCYCCVDRHLIDAVVVALRFVSFSSSSFFPDENEEEELPWRILFDN
jgi:hypothetical protein